MKIIDYANQWEDFFNLSHENLAHIDIESLDEENLDALAIRLKKLGDESSVIQVKEQMIKSDKNNPGVEYTHIFEDLIIYRMSKKDYSKALELLKAYLKYDEVHCKFYRYSFIKRNMGFCYICLNKEKKGYELINNLFNEQKENYWNYHDLAFEFFFSKMYVEAINILNKGLDQASRSKKYEWVNLFSSCIERLRNKFENK